MPNHNHHLSRRRFLAAMAGAGAASCLPGPLGEWMCRPAFAARRNSSRPRMVILGMDGMDPNLLKRFVDQGVMPHFKAFLATGAMKPLQTIDPPQSPVAWSTLITGMDPGGHGIYDFVARNPNSYQPSSSMSGLSPGRWQIGFGEHKIALLPPELIQMRQGTAFWEVLERHGITTAIHQIPANYPPVESGTSLSGMGTPDIRGTSGHFSFYTDKDTPELKKIEGGEPTVVTIDNYAIHTKLLGPPNTVKYPGQEHPPATEAAFSVYLSPSDPVAKFTVQDQEFILKEGEWSGWLPVEFSFNAISKVSATARFYLQEVRPTFRLYVTPLQINPADPAAPISSPERYSKDLQKALGYYYTQELPADTKAYRQGVFTGREFWTQSQMVHAEQMRALDYYLERFDKGPDLLFFYFSTLDQGCHMFWRDFDATHPDHQDDPFLSGALQRLYEEMDAALGKTLAVLGPEDTLVVMSDHGFRSFTRSVNVNSWLVEQGHLKLRFPNRRAEHRFFSNCRWDRSKAYNLGLNGLYINLRGREPEGLVEPGKEYEHLVRQIEEELLAMRDPETGRPVLSSITIPRRDYHGPMADQGPDLILGFAPDYRISWESPVGDIPEEIIAINRDPWSGDHCVDSRTVPGVLLTNRSIGMDEPALYDLTVAILNHFGIDAPPEMIGRNCLV